MNLMKFLDFRITRKENNLRLKRSPNKNVNMLMSSLSWWGGERWEVKHKNKTENIHVQKDKYTKKKTIRYF